MTDLVGGVDDTLSTRGVIPGVTIHGSAKLIGVENIRFGSPVLIDDFTLIVARESVTLGNYVHIACFSSITGGERVTIGDFAAVSQGARLLTGTDDFVDGVVPSDVLADA